MLFIDPNAPQVTAKKDKHQTKAEIATVISVYISGATLIITSIFAILTYRVGIETQNNRDQIRRLDRIIEQQQRDSTLMTHENNVLEAALTLQKDQVLAINSELTISSNQLKELIFTNTSKILSDSVHLSTSLNQLKYLHDSFPYPQNIFKMFTIDVTYDSILVSEISNSYLLTHLILRVRWDKACYSINDLIHKFIILRLRRAPSSYYIFGDPEVFFGNEQQQDVLFKAINEDVENLLKTSEKLF